MKILLYQDNTVNLDLRKLSSGLSQITKGQLDVAVGSSKIRLKLKSIKYPSTHRAVLRDLANELGVVDLALFVTKTPYENNYFYEAEEKLTILSFYAWEHLTDLPLENGLVFFISSVLRYSLPLPAPHEQATGCINDFLWDKSSVDEGMRSGKLCSICKSSINHRSLDSSETSVLQIINKLMNLLRSASRKNHSVLNYLKEVSPSIKKSEHEVHKSDVQLEQFDVFLCHNTQDNRLCEK